jgi:tetratricopeptide (TPR) repeat protein
MKKSALVLILAAFFSVSALAQTVQEGIGHLYAERYQSARSTFEKLLQVNPNNIDATYWLGQTMLAQKNVAGARAIYEKALAANGNAPLLMAGMGHVELMEGKKNEARSHFEAAINASHGKKGNDPNVLNAVGRANVMAYTEKNPAGDLDYAISKLTEASQLAPTNADIFLNLGNAYRKLGNKGGDAVMAYQKAFRANANAQFAPAAYRQAMLYRTQVSYSQPEAWSTVLEYLNAAIAADPKFAPAYLELYAYTLFGKRDYAAAETLANQVLANSDPGPDNDYLKMQTLILQKKFTEAATMGKNIIQQTNDNAKPIVYRAMTVIYLELKDSATACGYINQFFNKADDEDIIPDDYIKKAQACARNNPDSLEKYITMAVMKDTSLYRQRNILLAAITEAKGSGQRVLEGVLASMDYRLRSAKGATTYPTELINNISLPFLYGGAYKRSDSAAQEYIKIAPDSIYGYYWSANARAAMDTGANSQGSFVEPYLKTLDIALTDTIRYKTSGVKAASAVAIYYANIKRDYPKALEVVNKGLQVEGNNANLLNIKNVLSKYQQQPKQTSPPTQKTNTSSNTGKDVKTKTTPDKTKVKKG